MMKRWSAVLLIIAVVIVIVCLVLAITIPIALRHREYYGQTARTHAATVRMECSTENIDRHVCNALGCIYDTNEEPPCFRLEMREKFTFEQTSDSSEGIKGILTSPGFDGAPDNKWVMSIEYINDYVVRFSMNSKKKDRYTMPVPLNLQRENRISFRYQVHVYDKAGNFAFKIIRSSNRAVIWDLETEWNGLILTDQLLQITTRLPSTNIYGLGEHKHNSLKHKMGVTWPSFSRDQSPSFTEEANLYGVHPFYYCVEDGIGNTHGVLLWNSNAQEYAFSNKSSLTFRTIGGILDVYVFIGHSPESVVKLYTQAVGLPMMPPYWALGFQLSRYGYNNIENLKDAVDSTAHYNIPHDVQYVDIDHMEDQKGFTIDENRFPGLNDYFKSLQASGKRIIYLLDPCLLASDDYEPYRLMTEADGSIKWSDSVTVPVNNNDSTGALLGYVWPKDPVIFPDFFKKSTRDVWKKLIKEHRDKLTFDGLWIDMNEPASFGTNEEKPWNWPESRKPYWTLSCPNNTLEDPPYRPKAAYLWDTDAGLGRLSDKTICLSTVQGEENEYSHYDVHSLYGWSQTRPTLEAAQEATGERSIVITRSTFPGSGQSAGHWLGDNVSEWPDLHSSIIGMLEFNMFGIPYVGADICGFFGNTSASLCKRWMQLGAFYPFSRNHNGINNKNQGPGQLGDEVGNASREIMRIRYRLLPYLYNLFHEAHTKGSTVVRPLHHEFPRDKKTLSLDKQFLWGSCLLIIPILEENAKELSYYLPRGKWFGYNEDDFFTELLFSTGQEITTTVFEDSKPTMYVKGGCILFLQDPADNTQLSRRNPIKLLVSLDEDNTSHGSLFWDDGVSLDTYESGRYLLLEAHAYRSTFYVVMRHRDPGSPEWQSLKYEKVIVQGIMTPFSKVVVQYGRWGNETEVPFTASQNAFSIDVGSFSLVEDIAVKWW